MTEIMTLPGPVSDIINAGGLLAISHSGGKDSQAMTIKIINVGIPMDQIILVHDHLGQVEWPGTIRHIRATGFGLPLIIAKPRKSFFDMVRARGMFPSPKYRQCTSDLKRGPIERELRRYLAQYPCFNGQIVSAMGMRAEESSARANRSVLKVSQRNSKAGRHWIDWLPIHHMSTDAVFQTISAARQSPHWAYGAGMSRLSCSFCIMSSRADLQCAARLRPGLRRDYSALEAEINHTLSPTGRPLVDMIAPRGVS